MRIGTWGMGLVLVAALGAPSYAANIALEGFNTAPTNFTASPTSSGYQLKFTDSGGIDYPTSVPFFVEGRAAMSVTNGSYEITSKPFNTSTYSSVSLSLRLAAFALLTDTNGLDSSDRVHIAVSTDNGATYYKQVEASGFNSSTVGAYWNYTATGSATRAYAASNTTVVAAPAGTKSRTDGISTLSVTDLPSITNLLVRITVTNNNNNELWAIDDFKLTGDVRPDRYWIGSDTTRGGAGTWAQTGGAAWTNGDADGNAGLAWDATQAARFGGAGGAVAVDGTVQAGNGIRFLASGYTLSGGTIQLTGASAATNRIDVATGTATIGSSLTGSNGMTKSGAGKLILTGEGAYAGGTIVSEGTLAIGSGGSVPAGVIDVKPGAVLDVSASPGFVLAEGRSIAGNGSVTGTLGIAGVLAPGASIGTLSFTDGVVLSGDSVFEINDQTSAADRAEVAGAITFGGDLVVTNLGNTQGYYDGQVFDLFDFGSATGSFASIALPTLPEGLAWRPFDYSTGELSVTAAPEPASMGAAVVGAFLLGRRARRRD